MSWLFSQALVEEYLGENFSDGEQFVQLSGSHTQQAFCAPDKMTNFSRLSRFGMTYKPLTEYRGEELLTLYLEASRARTLAQQAKAQGLTESDQGCGEKWRASFAKYDQDSCSWKTHQCSLLGDLEPYSEIWPRWGLMRDGECWEQPTLGQTIKETEFGLKEKEKCLDVKNVDMNLKLDALQDLDAQDVEQHNQKSLKWPTPRSCSAMAATITPESAWNESRNPNLETIVGRRMFPTPTAHDAKDTGTAPSEGRRNTPCLAYQAGGKLNPTWVEWLMGWPLGWTDLKPLETDKCHYVQQQHGES